MSTASHPQRYWLSVSEAAWLLDESERRVRQMDRAGELLIHAPAVGATLAAALGG